MKRREFIAALDGLAAWPFAAVKPIAALPCLDWRLGIAGGRAKATKPGEVRFEPTTTFKLVTTL